MNDKRIPVILDTDIGGDIDDTWAMAQMLKSPELDVKLIVSDTGDTVYRGKIIAKLLEAAGRTDIPVGIGLRQPSDGPRERQAAWVRDYRLESFPGRVHEDGVGAMIDVIMGSAEPVTLIGISPAPNIAEALRRSPGMAGRARFVGMFGSIAKEHDGKAGAIAEWNVKCDIAACQQVFAAAWREMTITPLDTCGMVRLDGERYARVRDCRERLTAAVMENYRIWAKATEWHKDGTETRTSILYDTVAIHLAYSTRFLRMEPMGIRVRDDGFTVVDPAARPVNVAIAWTDFAGYCDWLVERLVGRSSEF